MVHVVQVPPLLRPTVLGVNQNDDNLNPLPTTEGGRHGPETESPSSSLGGKGGSQSPQSFQKGGGFSPTNSGVGMKGGATNTGTNTAMSPTDITNTTTTAADTNGLTLNLASAQPPEHTVTVQHLNL